MSPPDYDMALVCHAIHLELSDRIGYVDNVNDPLTLYLLSFPR
jgi:hypothetical protein